MHISLFINSHESRVLRLPCLPRTLSHQAPLSSAPASSSVWERNTGLFLFLQILAPELNDRLLADFLDMESSLIGKGIQDIHHQ